MVRTFAAELKGVLSIQTLIPWVLRIVQPKPAWVRIWDIFSLKEDVKLPHCRAKASPQVTGIGKLPLWAYNAMELQWKPIAVPLKHLLTTVCRNQGLA